MTDQRIPREWGVVFPEEEYQRRVSQVREEMARRGIELLYVSSPRNLTYLTGYDSVYYGLKTPTGLALRVDQDGFVFFDFAGHRHVVEQHALVLDAVYFRRDGIDTIIDTLRDRGWLRGTVGIEKWSRSPAGPVLGELEERMGEAGAKIVDGSWTVDRVALIKSSLEIEMVRQAAAIADIGMEAARRALRPGVTEAEVRTEIDYAMGKAGGGEPAIRTMVGVGPDFLTHAPPRHHKIRLGDDPFIDFCGSFNRYHADLGRTFFLGEPDRKQRDLLHTLSKSLTAVMATVKPGDPMTAIDKVVKEYVDSVGLTASISSIIGYDIGISVPPDWVGHTRHDGSGFEQADLLPGTVTNYEIFCDYNGFIDTILMTESGIEVLSKIDRELIVVEGS